MQLPDIANKSKGRLRAAFLCGWFFWVGMALSACAGGNGGPFSSTVATFIPGEGDYSRQAESIPYASIALSVAGHGGLLVLAEKSDRVTFWQTSTGETVVLANEYLEATRGLSRDLLSARVVGESSPPWHGAVGDPVSYKVERSWRDSEGREKAGQGNATLTCGPEREKLDLPLAAIRLERCREVVSWSNGKQTASVIWRSPGDRHIWAAEVVPWPGGPVIAWRVARPWW